MVSGTGYGYRDLIVWQKGMELAKSVYILTQKFPTEEKYGLVSQMRRAVVSIPSNIAEGQARHTTKEFIQFISHADGSLAELDTQTRLGLDLGYHSNIETEQLFALMEELRKMLNSLRRSLSAKEP
ncbi:MAG: four helix bundle protein [Terriglobia bacterium]